MKGENLEASKLQITKLQTDKSQIDKSQLSELESELQVKVAHSSEHSGQDVEMCDPDVHHLHGEEGAWQTLKSIGKIINKIDNLELDVQDDHIT